MKKIGTDLDGVVIAWHEYFIEDLNKRYNKSLTLEDWTDYGFSKSGFSQERIWKEIDRESQTCGFLRPEPIKESLLYLKRLRNDKHTIHIITHRLNGAKQDAITWLDDRNVEYESISFSKDKRKICYLLGLDCMIEDDLQNALKVASVGIETLLFDRPYNQFDLSTQPNPLITRVKTWQEIYELLK